MATCFVLEKSGHNGDHAWNGVDTISFDKDKLEAIRAERYSDQAAFNAQLVLINEFKREYEKQNDCPSWNDISKFGVIQKVPKFKAGLRKEEITQEMRDNRDRINAENSVVSEAFYEAVSNWTKARDAEIIKKFQLAADHDLHSYSGSYERAFAWDIIECEFV